MQTTSDAQRNPGIDLLRGLSIILVLIHHLALRIPLMQTGLSAVFPAMLLKALNWDGGKGVKIFFVISGFLITDHTLRRWGSLGGINAIAFSARRACRILPCLLVLLGILAALNLAGTPDFLFHHEN
nr:acyltransferase [Gluconobacter vitians]